MKTILFLTKGVQSSSSRYRASVYFDKFSKDNINIKHYGLSKTFINYFKAIIFSPFYDVIFLQRKLISRPLFYLLRIFSKKIIYDFDDSVYLNSDGTISKNKYKKFYFICKNSDLIFAGNSFLAEFASKLNKKTYVVPTCVDIKKYDGKKIKSKVFFDAVWIGHKSTVKYLKEIIPYLEEANNRLKNLRLINISNTIINSELINIKNVKWEEDTHYKYLKSCQVGLAPLDKTQWSKGKCAFKVIQYAASGIPILSSSVGENKILINKYNCGMLSNNKSSWIKNLTEIMENKNLYKLLSINCIKMAKDFDININYKKIKNIIENEI